MKKWSNNNNIRPFYFQHFLTLLTLITLIELLGQTNSVKLTYLNSLANLNSLNIANMIETLNKNMEQEKQTERETEAQADSEKRASLQERLSSMNLLDSSANAAASETSTSTEKNNEKFSSDISLIKTSIKALIENFNQINGKLNWLSAFDYEIKNVEVDMPDKGKEQSFKHELNIDDIFNIDVSVINGPSNNRIMKSQMNLSTSKVLFNWYLDNENFYLIRPNNLNASDDSFLEGSKVRLSFILKKDKKKVN